jgi:hypothetical protein
MRSIKHQIFYFPEAETHLNFIHELECDTSTDSAFFFGLVHICHNIQRLTIIHTGKRAANHGIVKLIEVQTNLKYFEWKDEFGDDYYVDEDSYNEIFLSLAKKAHTLTHFITYINDLMFPLKVISELRNLETLILLSSFDNEYNKALENSSYPNLEILHLGDLSSPRAVIHIIENTGGHLKKILINSYSVEGYFLEFFSDLIRAVCKNCPLIEFLTLTLHYYNDLTEFEKLLKTCQKLRGLLLNIESMPGKKKRRFEYGERLFKMLVKSAPISIRELRFFDQFKISLETLGIFLENWKGRPALSIFTCDHEYQNDEYMEIVNKYRYDGVVEDFICVIDRMYLYF